ncbi:BQ5605_C006g04225 [Microbotryum silenes-dioicae]|uniref:BQ5605_C006g04225 protein n=1 Tax=Microbotryum silenes-dioicae TaxID=796604 RepID=A0A2X0M9B9_9BASI|nr:BQ5605_C006g04225 [Microbotryum silenes-dioicae]
MCQYLPNTKLIHRINVSRGLCASPLDHLALHPDPQCLGGIKAPALIAKSNGVIQLMGPDTTVKYEVVKRMLANAEAAGVSGQELDLPVF